MAVAHARADHQIVDGARVFADPLAVRIVEGDDRGANDFQEGLDDDAVRHRRLLIAARSRFADEAVAAAIDRGVDQVVVLGAGLDTAAYRNTRADIRFFEVDHPVTQEWKRQRLARTGIEVPASLTFAPVDFEQSTLADGLAAVGFDRGRGVIFVWLGVVVYLTRQSIEDTLRYIAEQDGPVEVVFDYRYPVAAPDRQRVDRVAAVGEPWLSFFDEDEMRSLLQSLGYERIRDLSAARILDDYGIASRPTDSVVHLVHAGAR
ncbi:methyltransferase (TIGR00027 family) [Nocardia pseudobrasiliensis]|uniref:S-adenosyl-L-methionine-dependent methyltransferase n=2 Tax=Nocardia pseudobrasiliensis TaxID=45979 RepID=A0A370I4N8_9NOCA|nr:methyltransferase (TIGR00027 family) [Nocardia pseudobrasiliensis]